MRTTTPATIRGVRRAKRLSLEETASRAGTTKTTVLRIELGQSEHPNPKTVAAILAAIGIGLTDDVPPLPVRPQPEPLTITDAQAMVQAALLDASAA